MLRFRAHVWAIGIVFFFFFCLSIEDTVAERSRSLFPSLEQNDHQSELHAGLVSEKQWDESHGADATSTMDGLLPPFPGRDNWLFKAFRTFSHRVFRLSNEEEQWPTLKFGWRTICGVILGGIGAAMSSAGGIGGGGLFVPLFNLLLEFDAKTSTALSNFMILGGSFTNLYINLRQHHPTIPHKPLIDFDVVMLLQPNMLLGISAGVILNVVLPGWSITALLTVTLFYMTFHSCNCAFARWRKETQQNRRKTLANGCSNAYVPAPDFHDKLHSSSEESSSSDNEDYIPPAVVGTHEKEGDEERQEKFCISGKVAKDVAVITADESLSEHLLPHNSRCRSPELPMDKITALVLTWLAFFAVQVLRGGKGNQSIVGISACGLGYWILTFLQLPLALGITGWTISRFHATHSCKEDSESCIEEDGFSLKPESCTYFAFIAFGAGMMGGLLGIGGGMIINPLMIGVGMLPQVTSGTCASMVFFSSSMSVVQFWLMGKVPVGYALTSALLCAIFSTLGISLVHRAIDKFNRASLIVFSVSTVMGISGVLMAGFGSSNVWNEYRSGAYMGFHYPC